MPVTPHSATTDMYVGAVERTTEAEIAQDTRALMEMAEKGKRGKIKCMMGVTPRVLNG